MKIVALFAAAVMFCTMVSFTMAKEDAKTETLKGTATCAKCDLKKTEKCQAALVVKEDGKEVVYYIKMDKEGKAIHGEICKAPKEGVEVTGVVTEKDGQKWITVASKKE